MSPDKFIKNKTVLITLISACLIVIISLGIRQTFGMFYFDFSTDLGITLSQFGFALGLQMLLWGVFGPWFGVITDKYGGHIAVFIGFIFYLIGILMLYSQYNTGSTCRPPDGGSLTLQRQEWRQVTQQQERRQVGPRLSVHDAFCPRSRR